MIPKTFIVRALCALAAGLVGAGMASSASQMPEKEIIIFSPDVFKQRKYGPVRYHHDKHAHLKCDYCHHEYVNGENVWLRGQEVKRCHDCHKLQTTEGLPSLERAMHDHCFSCHKRLAKDGLKGGPTTCVRCHPKQTDAADKK